MAQDTISKAETVYDVKLTLTSEMLGTVPKNRDLYRDYIAGKAELPKEVVAEELESVPDPGPGKDEESGWTGFHTDAEGAFIYDYVIKGFFKDVCGMLRRAAGTHSKRLTAYKKVIDGLVFADPRKIHFRLPEGAEIGVLERPLRAQTAQGERVALARSDTVPAGTVLHFSVSVIGNQVTAALLREWFSYGRRRGLGQWRNAGYGTFTYTLTERQ